MIISMIGYLIFRYWLLQELFNEYDIIIPFNEITEAELSQIFRDSSVSHSMLLHLVLIIKELKLKVTMNQGCVRCCICLDCLI